jgi:hypothetical protein
MTRRGRFATALCCFVLLAWPTRVRAQSAAHDTQLWLLLLGQLRVGEQWLVHAEAQPRWNDDISRSDQVLLRGAIGRRLGTRASVWAGYAYTPRQASDDWTHEQRLWQQLSVAFPRAGRWTPSIRIRPEQRLLESWGDASYRLRALGRLVRPLGASPWSIAASDEYFVTLDDTEDGPRRGFDQNRVFIGMLRRLSSEATIETGYLWQWLPESTTQPQRHNHTVLVWLAWTP